MDSTLSGFMCKQPGPILSHLFFGDDSFLFSKASIEESRSVCQLLDAYSVASSQVINYDKSTMCCSKSISWAEGDWLASLVGVKHVNC